MSTKIPGIKLRESEVSQTIDLSELFGVPFTGMDALKQEIGQRMIELILKRTDDGVSVEGHSFKKYNPDYVESLEFKAYGKSEDEVNLNLTGQMMGTLDVFNLRGGKIKLGWSDDVENAKAYNHNVGDTVKRRPFFGLNQGELEDIKNEFADRIEHETKFLEPPARRTAAELLENLNAVDRIVLRLADEAEG